MTSFGASEPTTGGKITERVVLWFLMWLSKITQEVAETTQTECQDIQGGPDLSVFLNKPLAVIPRVRGWENGISQDVMLTFQARCRRSKPAPNQCAL